MRNRQKLTLLAMAVFTLNGAVLMLHSPNSEESAAATVPLAFVMWLMWWLFTAKAYRWAVSLLWLTSFLTLLNFAMSRDLNLATKLAIAGGVSGASMLLLWLDSRPPKPSSKASSIAPTDRPPIPEP